MEFVNLFGMIVKMGFLVAWIYGLLRVLDLKSWWRKALGLLVAFGIIQLLFSLQFGEFQIFSPFDQGLVYQACTMAMIALGLNLIYGFNGQFSLAQWGFYGVGAYCSADITYRWLNGDARGLIVVSVGVVLAGLLYIGVARLLKLRRGVPVLSAFTFYLLATVAAGAVAILAGRLIAPAFTGLLGTAAAPGPWNGAVGRYAVFTISVLLAGAFAAEMSFLVGLPILTLGSDYFGIATLGFSIVLQTLMINSDTILPFPEMKGGRGMIGIPKLINQNTWAFAFVFLVVIIVVMRNLIRSSTGRTVMAVREDEVASKAMGVDVAGTKLLAFVVGSLFAGVGGAVYAHYIGFLSRAAVQARHRGPHVALRALPHHPPSGDAAAAAGPAGIGRVGLPQDAAAKAGHAAGTRSRAREGRGVTWPANLPPAPSSPSRASPSFSAACAR
ncbi:MAG: branched-chain amino acid ABC transporter permease [Spirochaetes bacterium]|nr:branched-chain amino acid ABC transporter permease [Spirochaetota bacterium]